MMLTRRQAISSLGSSLLLLPGFSRVAAGARGPLADTAAQFLRRVAAGDLDAVTRMLADDATLARSVDGADRSAFVIAHLHGHVDVSRRLFDAGIELDLVEAVLAEDWERMEELAAATPDRLHVAHPFGGTPLHASAWIGGQDGWRLRKLGCDPDANPDGGTGFTPARGAVDTPHIAWARMGVREMLSNGADPNAPQRGGDSILHGAVRRRDATLVRLAIRKGADVDATDDDGRTALELAAELEWDEGARQLRDHHALPRDHRASRFAVDANREPVDRPDLSDVPQALQSEVTGSSHMRIQRVRELVTSDPRLVFSISTDDELAIEASAHMGNHALMRYHLDHGAPMSLPTAVSICDHDMIRYHLDHDPDLIHERGAHDFALMWYALIGGGSVEVAELLFERGVPIDQESVGTTTLHWCARRNDEDLAKWLVEQGADVDRVGYQWSRDGQTPLQVTLASGRNRIANILRDAGARG